MTVPGDKSISQRALILAALATGPSSITGLGDGADVRTAARCLMQLGTEMSGTPELQITPRAFTEPDDVLDVGNSGTALRCLTGLCSGVPGIFTVLTGDRSIRSRPMLRVVAPLREMGAAIAGARHGDRAPLAVSGTRLRGIHRTIDVASAQVKTALLLAGLLADGSTEIVAPGPVRDHTERMLAALGGPVSISGTTTKVVGGWRPDGFRLHVPGDISSAMFLVGAALLVPRSELSIEGLGLNPTRTGALEVLRTMGADVHWEVTGEVLGEPVGTVTARHTVGLTGVEVSGTELIPRLIDEVPLLAVVAAAASGTTTFRDATELRVKESDRIATLVGGLRRLGVEAEELPDGLAVTGSEQVLAGGTVEAHGDHRIAMAFAVAGLATAGKVRVEGWKAIETSFPTFLDLVARAQGRRVRSG